MKKIIFLFFMISIVFQSRAQSDCFITYVYDNSGNRIERYYNCPVEEEEMPPSAQINTTKQINLSKLDSVKNNTYSIVYPNPNPGKFWVEFKPVLGNDKVVNLNIDRKIYLLDATGKVVFELQSNESKVAVEVANLVSGNYFVVINDGNKNASQKIVIKH